MNVAYAHIVSPVTGRVGLAARRSRELSAASDASGIVVITQIDPISVVFTTPEDNLPRISARLKSGAKLPVTVLDRDNVHALRRNADDLRQPDRHHHRHDQDAGDVRQSQRGPVPATSSSTSAFWSTP